MAILFKSVEEINNVIIRHHEQQEDPLFSSIYCRCYLYHFYYHSSNNLFTRNCHNDPCIRISNVLIIRIVYYSTRELGAETGINREYQSSCYLNSFHTKND